MISSIKFKKNDIWWIDFNCNFTKDCGKFTHISKIRPAIIVSDGYYNKANSKITVIPITTNLDNEDSYCFPITISGEDRMAIISEITAIDKGRFQKKLATLDPDDALELREEIIGYLSLD